MLFNALSVKNVVINCHIMLFNADYLLIAQKNFEVVSLCCLMHYLLKM